MSYIDDELYDVQNDSLGEHVRNAIADAMEIINNYRVDISYELYFIRNGRYGRDIRMSIHDALYKLSMGIPEEHYYPMAGKALIIVG
jgi:hypothetical protein